MAPPTIVVVMGVAGAGKTTVGELLAARLGWEFADADGFHTPENVEKMRRGQPLTDADRGPWLDRLAAGIDGWIAAKRPTVLACSALRRAYRDRLAHGRREVLFLHLDAPRAELSARLAARRGHYMPASLLDSQLATLEQPGADEAAVIVDASGTPAQVVGRAVAALGAGRG